MSKVLGIIFHLFAFNRKVLRLKSCYFGDCIGVMADCFIIMPISTPESLAPLYGGDKDHFKHVLECLFIPAVEKAGLKPILPIATGADLIHAEVVQNLEKAEMVLCDMSSLNANVFFELGIRTAIGKPICMVKDDVTPKAPFDMTVINHHEYPCALPSWTLAKDVDQLSAHIKTSIERSKGENQLWKYFSLDQKAHLTPPTSKDETTIRLAMLSSQMEGLSAKFDTLEQRQLRSTSIRRILASPAMTNAEAQGARRLNLFSDLAKFATARGFAIIEGRDVGSNGDTMMVSTLGSPQSDDYDKMREIAKQFGYKLIFNCPSIEQK